jgi:hypothetical protein
MDTSCFNIHYLYISPTKCIYKLYVLCDSGKQ